jgi:hypothetical protein
LLAFLVIILALALPGAASAATIGSNLDGTSSPLGCEIEPTCILSQNELEGDIEANVFSQPGTVTGFTFRHVTGAVAFVVLRMTDNGGYTVVKATSAVTGSGRDERQTYLLKPGIHIRQDDFIGLALAPGASVGARDAEDEETTLLELANGPAPILLNDEEAAELFLQASWVPSATDLGPTYGLVSTVPDALASLRAGERPTVRISTTRVRASKRYSVAIAVRNPNGYRVKGRLSLRRRGRKLGSRAFSVRAHSSRSVRVTLSRRARRLLARRRKLRVTARAFVRGPIGRAGRASRRITITAPR